MTARATKFQVPKFPTALPQYSESNEQAFRKMLEAALSGVFVATNNQASASLGLSLLGWSHTLVFSATDHDTVAWTSGSILLPDGTTYSINAGNTGNITTVTYIYLDLAVSATVLQTTTTASSAVGVNRILVAVANDVASGKDAQFQVMGGADESELVLITADVIAADTITANEIAANTITAAEIAAGTITANEIAANTITGANIASLNISTKTITADTGTIGGWSLTASTLFSGQITFVSGATPKITLGDATDYASGDGIFLGLHSGAYKLRIGGASAGPYFRWSGTAIETSAMQILNPSTGSSPSLLGWSHDLVFSATDHDTVAWGSGTIRLQSGDSWSISAGNTGNISALTYIFLDIDVSATVLQTTTTASDAVGHNRILVAVAQNVASGKDAQFQVFGGGDAQKLALITADGIAANTITANEIAANTITAAEIAAATITADRLSVSTLSSITADIGTITAGTINTNVLIAAESFTAANPVFTGNLVIEASEGEERFIFDTNSGDAYLRLFDSAGDPAGFLFAGTSQIGFITAGNRDIVLDLTSGSGTITLDPVARMQFDGGANIINVMTGTTTWNPGSIAASGATSTTITVTGAVVGDPVFFGDEFQQDNTNLKLAARVSATDTVTLHLHNTHPSASIDPGSRTIRVCVFQFA